MSSHATLEHAEHAAHAGHAHHDGHGHGDGKLSGKVVGVTMALIAVLLAFCAAMVGSERNELMRAMIEQTQAHSDYTSASTKFRLIMLDLEKQRGALTPAANADAAPSPVLVRLLRLYLDYSSEKTLSNNWAAAYEPLIEVHFEAAEAYEKAQLIAEIAIVAASLAVLLQNRSAWILSLVIAALSVGQIGRTWVHTSGAAESVLVKVAKSDEAYHELRKQHSGANEDEQTVDQLDPGGRLRAQILAVGKKPAEEAPAH